MNWVWKSLVALGSAAIVVFLVWRDVQHDQQGDLAAVHAQVAELKNGMACDACHGDDDTSMQQACLHCHESLAKQLKLQQGLHAQLKPAQLSECGNCHLEHVGKDYELSGERSFRLAGFPGPDGFEHGYSAFDLHGKHDSLSCKDCHPHADAQPLAEGEQRYMGQVQACEHCHEDPHRGEMKRGCTECHGQVHPFTDMRDFEHHADFPLHASHSGLKCAECHEDGSEHSVAALSGDVDFNVWRSCVQCHELPHRAEFVDGAGCEDCHSEEHRSFAGDEAALTVEQHAKSGFALQIPHQDLACEKCHGPELGNTFTARFPGREADRCKQCHADPHQGQFDHAPYQERGCLSCHHQDRFHPHQFDVDRHQLTDYPLLHSHQQVECNLCHQDGKFADTANRCEQCHDDAHRQAFSTRVDPDQLCESCHQPSQFRDLTTPFDHDHWTDFALAGAHGKLDCEKCHARTAADEHGRTFGWASSMHDGNPAACTGCHADVHAGIFDLASVPKEYRGEQGCARCHNQSHFEGKDAVSAFEHQLWTQFELVGAHKQASCLSCHGDGLQQTPPRRLATLHSQFAGQAPLCHQCHNDPHDGMFQVKGQQDCEQCHNNLSFRQVHPEFEHGKWTGFALQGEHKQASCLACHPHLPKADASGRTTARALGTACHECHADVHVGQFAEQGQTSCQSCHSVFQPEFLIPDFDHQKQTKYPLDETHQKVSCAECHPRWQLEGGGNAVRYRGTPTKCQDCHQVVPGEGGKQ